MEESQRNRGKLGEGLEGDVEVGLEGNWMNRGMVERNGHQARGIPGSLFPGSPVVKTSPSQARGAS